MTSASGECVVRLTPETLERSHFQSFTEGLTYILNEWTAQADLSENDYASKATEEFIVDETKSSFIMQQNTIQIPPINEDVEGLES